MKLEEFAKSAGCVVKLMPKDEFEQGRWAYYEKNTPHNMFVGFRTEKAAYKAFIEDSFGSEEAASAVLKILAKVQRLENDLVKTKLYIQDNT